MSKPMSYEKLDELFAEVSEVLSETLEDNRSLQDEMKYLKDFISWKSLSSEYLDFRENAFLDTSDELPFPYYIM